MKLVQYVFTGFTLAAVLMACSNDSSPPSGAAPLNDPNAPIVESQPKDGQFSVREILSSSARNLGQYTSGKRDAGIFCKLIDVPNSAYGKLIAIEAMWTFQSADKTEKEFYRVKIESQSARDIMPGKNSYDFVDAQVRLYRSKSRRAALADLKAVAPAGYSCDISNFERQGQKLSGRIQCSKDNVYKSYSLRLNFDCTLD